ncbi:hypothetical protein BD769DRAFT_1479744 [Suillus cothurnatus]|nr:hypothetical protein BD769DRAFT_1479744 [Suillus cothurnatus]
MSRLHPALLYLTIYNPTLCPSEEVSKDDEDAEEQAQILFYTSQERATSRDKMLRQVGLAKALVNFSEIFHPTDSCHNVHSQSRRMIMLNPEPDFWIHAAGNGKGKEKEKEQASALQPSYDCHDGSLHDYALRAYLLRGYEQFKLTHGSFTSILNSLGQEALELQLERFFTVWAWSWDLSKSFELNDDLGLSLHPLYPSILPLLDTFHRIPSTRYRRSNHPLALSRHLLSLIPRHLPRHEADDRPEASSPTEKGTIANTAAKEVGSGSNSSGGFLGMPSSLAMSMGVRNWSWPGALTFGKGAERKSPVTERKEIKPNPSVAESPSTVTEVDRGALEDAMSSADIHNLLEKTNDGLSSVTDPDAVHEGRLEADHSGDTPRPSRVPSPLPAHGSSSSPLESEKPDRYRHLDFACTFVFLPESGDSLETHRRQVIHLRCQSLAVALIADVDNVEDYDTHVISEAASQMLHGIENLIVAEATRVSEILPSATKILQPKDNYLISFDHFTTASPDFVAKSDNLYNGKQLLEQELHINEVFSRGQQPQHWHVLKRDNTSGEEREVFLEVARKETSLSDVDNILQRFQLHSL